MKLPSKLINYDNSTFKQFEMILIALKEENNISPNKLYQKVRKHFLNIAQFQEAFDLLYLLGKLRLTINGKVELC